jgi:small subunit ribosomal protein S1
VMEVNAKGAVVQLADGVEGTLRASDISRERVDDARTILKVDDEVEAKFVGVDKKNRSITLSIKAKDTEEEAEAVQEYKAGEGAGTTTLGDILKEQMESQKE